MCGCVRERARVFVCVCAHLLCHDLHDLLADQQRVPEAVSDRRLPHTVMGQQLSYNAHLSYNVRLARTDTERTRRI